MELKSSSSKQQHWSPEARAQFWKKINGAKKLQIKLQRKLELKYPALTLNFCGAKKLQLQLKFYFRLVHPCCLGPFTTRHSWLSVEEVQKYRRQRLRPFDRSANFKYLNYLERDTVVQFFVGFYAQPGLTLICQAFLQIFGLNN